jgi:hypothetical protein
MFVFLIIARYGWSLFVIKPLFMPGYAFIGIADAIDQQGRSSG